MIGIIPKILLENKDKWKYENDKMVAVGTVTSDIQQAIDDQNGNISKSDFQIAKADEDKRLVFGWALVSATSDGEQIIDHQGDIVDQDELEDGAYEYVLNFRDAGEEHISSLRKKARMVESVVFTEEKLQAMGIPQGTVPYGWWIGFYVDDDDTWEKIKNGTYSMFSIEGKAVREPVNEPLTKSEYEPSETVAKTFYEILKFNPYHDRLGRFTSAGGAASMTIRTSSKLWQNAADKAIAREKERTAQSNKGPKPMTEQEYLDSKGVGDSTSGWVLDKLRSNRQIMTQRGKNRFERDRDKAEEEYQKRREQAKQEYKEKVKSGELRDKTDIEIIIDRANGNPDNRSTQAARRVAEKRGIDWKTGKPLNSANTRNTTSGGTKAIVVEAPDGTKLSYRVNSKGVITDLDGTQPKNTNGMTLDQIHARAKEIGWKVKTYDDKQIKEYDTQRAKEREETNRQLNDDWYRAAPKPRNGWKGH